MCSWIFWPGLFNDNVRSSNYIASSQDVGVAQQHAISRVGAVLHHGWLLQLIQLDMMVLFINRTTGFSTKCLPTWTADTTQHNLTLWLRSFLIFWNVLFTGAVNCCNYISAATDESMSTEHWLNDTGWEYRRTRTTTCPTDTLSTQIPYGESCDSTPVCGERPANAWAMAWTWSSLLGWRWKFPRLWHPTYVAEDVLDEE